MRALPITSALALSALAVTPSHAQPAATRLARTAESRLGAAPAVPAAPLDSAEVLGRAGKHAAAIALYRAWLVAHPGDTDAELALARTLGWAGALREASSIYDRLAAAGSVEARKGVARMAAWRGDLARSESLWRALVGERPADMEAWTGLAQVLRWRGQPRAAESALARVLRAYPKDADAAEQMRWLRADLATWIAPSVTYASDNEKNAIATTTAGLSLAPRAAAGGTLRGGLLGQLRRAALPGVSAHSERVRGSLAWSSAGGFTLGAELGGALRTARGADGAVARGAAPVGAVHAALALPRGGSVQGTLSRAPFDETAALIRSRIDATAGELGASLPLGAGLVATGSVGRVALSGGSAPNGRWADAQSLRWSPASSVTLGAARRAFAYDRAAADGYFAPRRFALVEATAGAALGGALGWRAEGELGLGRQTIALGERAESHGARRLVASLAYRPRPGAELALSVSAANAAPVSGSVGGAGYEGRAVTLRARVPAW